MILQSLFKPHHVNKSAAYQHFFGNGFVFQSKKKHRCFSSNILNKRVRFISVFIGVWIWTDEEHSMTTPHRKIFKDVRKILFYSKRELKKGTSEIFHTIEHIASWRCTSILYVHLYILIFSMLYWLTLAMMEEERKEYKVNFFSCQNQHSIRKIERRLKRNSIVR